MTTTVSSSNRSELDKLPAQGSQAPARNSLGGAEIYALVAGPEVVWAGTNNGAFKYHPERREWKQYTTEDGLIDDHLNAIALDRELVWFGTDLGLTVFRWQAFHRFE